MTIKPRQTFPNFNLPTVDGDRFVLAYQKPSAFSMLVFYRGLHCPLCKTYLSDLDRKLTEFSAAGVEAIAISTDSKERAEQSKKEWKIGKLRIAYDLTVEQARHFGLYISESIKESEPPVFAEPGLFLVRPDMTLYCASVQTMPFARPSWTEVLQAITFVTSKNYPARGEA